MHERSTSILFKKPGLHVTEKRKLTRLLSSSIPRGRVLLIVSPDEDTSFYRGSGRVAILLDPRVQQAGIVTGKSTLVQPGPIVMLSLDRPH